MPLLLVELINPLARETSQCQHLRGLKPAAQGPCGQDQSFLLADKWGSLGHVQAAWAMYRQLCHISSRKNWGR